MELPSRFQRPVFLLAGQRWLRPRLFLSMAMAIAAVSAAPVTARGDEMKCPPPTRVDDVKETIHGMVLSDPYRWLEDQNNPETRAWIDAQNACTQNILKTLPGRAAISTRIGELIKVDTILH